MFSTVHSRKRVTERNISRREVQTVIKYGGEGILQENGRHRVDHGDKRVILENDRQTVVTAHKTKPKTDLDWELVGKHGKQPTRKESRMAIFSDGSLKPIPTPFKEDIKTFLQDNNSIDARARGRLDSLRGLEACMSQKDVQELLASMPAGTRNSSAVVSARVKNLLKSIAEEWRADEVEEYLRVHGIRREVSTMFRDLPEDQRKKIMHETSFFDAQDKSAVLKQQICASFRGVGRRV